MKCCGFLPHVILLASLAGSVSAETLITPSFVITIETNCEEGEVACDKVTYNGKSRKSGKSIKLAGTTLHTMCADGITPCRFLGYQFKNGNISYTVLADGRLEVIQGENKVLVDEQGEWQP